MIFFYSSIEEFNAAYAEFTTAFAANQPWNDIVISTYDSWAARPTVNGGISSIILGITYHEETS